MSATPLSAAHDITPPSPRIAKVLTDLPNEILLEIIENFKLDIESLPDHGFSSEGVEPVMNRYESRFRGNKSRELTLRLLCLTCKRLCALSSQVLYSSIILECPPISNFERLFLLLRTVLHNQHLADCIKYVEMPAFDGWFGPRGLDEYVQGGNEQVVKGWIPLLTAMTKVAAFYWGPPQSLFAEWTSQVRLYPELALAAILVAKSPNILHLKFGTMWESLPLFLRFFGLDMTAFGMDRPDCTLSLHPARKLKRLTVLLLAHDVHDWDHTAHPQPELQAHKNERLAEVMRKLQVTPEVWIIGRTFWNGDEDTIRLTLPLRELFPSMSSISFLDTNATPQEVVHAIGDCNALTRCKIIWEDWYTQGPIAMSSIIRELQSSKDSLRYLNLTKRTEFRFDHQKRPFDFSMFRCLTKLVIPYRVLFGDDGSGVEAIDEDNNGEEFWVDVGPARPVSKCLPASIVEVHVLHADHEMRSDNPGVWSEFARDLHLMPRLKNVTLDYGQRLRSWENEWHMVLWMDWKWLIDLFAEKGVHLSVQEHRDSVPSDPVDYDD